MTRKTASHITDVSMEGLSLQVSIQLHIRTRDRRLEALLQRKGDRVFRRLGFLFKKKIEPFSFYIIHNNFSSIFPSHKYNSYQAIHDYNS
jgi:hypothetical protein